MQTFFSLVATPADEPERLSLKVKGLIICVRLEKGILPLQSDRETCSKNTFLQAFSPLGHLQFHCIALVPRADNFTQALLVMLVTNIM